MPDKTPITRNNSIQQLPATETAIKYFNDDKTSMQQ